VNELMRFEFENKEHLECIELNGEPLFNPFSVGKCLEIADKTVSNTLHKMDGEDVLNFEEYEMKDIARLKGKDSPRFWLRESGLYLFIFKSRKPEAKAFKKWVAREVLPSIRKTGKYSLSKSDSFELNSSLNTMQRLDVVNPYEIAGANNQSYRAKLANLINDVAKRNHKGPQVLYEELYHVFAAKSGVYIPEQAELACTIPKLYLKKHEVLSENLYNFAVNYFYEGKMVVELINLDPAQKTLGEF